MDEIRKRLIKFFLIVIACIFTFRLFYLQIIDESYTLDAQNNAIRKLVQMPFRGLVYDRHDSLLVYNTPVYDLYITPKKAKVQDTLRFCRLFGISRPLFDTLTKRAKIFSPVRPSVFLRQLSKVDYAAVQDAMVDYPGFNFQISALRTYKYKALANVLGYVGEISPERLKKKEEEGDDYYHQGDYVGVTGLERYYEEQLRGQRGEKYMMVNSRGIEKGSFQKGRLDKQPVAGQSLHTTVDIKLQEFAESLMQHKVGSIVAIEPQTGEVLAMVSAPTYNPSLLSGHTFSSYFKYLNKNPLHPLLNRPPSAYYRPGSTFKLIQALVGLQTGALTPGTVFGHAGAPVKCHGHPIGDLRNAIQWSCNPYFYHAFKRIIYNNNEHNVYKKSAEGLKGWDERVAKFGIGQELGIDLPNEKKGKLPSVEFYNKIYKGEFQWKFSNIASLGIGEGEIVISPLKMANVAAIIANRGWYYRPHLTRGVGKEGNIDPKYKEKLSVGIDKRNFDVVIDGMVSAVNHGTVAAEARMYDVQICGKTGTSQNRRGEDHSIFIAFAPRDNPKIAIAVFVENAGFGGFHAAPIASLCIERFLKGKVLRTGMANRWMNKSYFPNVQRVKGLTNKDSTSIRQEESKYSHFPLPKPHKGSLPKTWRLPTFGQAGFYSTPVIGNSPNTVEVKP